jgi:hypothetical protein
MPIQPFRVPWGPVGPWFLARATARDRPSQCRTRSLVRLVRPGAAAVALVAATACGDDGTSPDALDLSGTYVVTGVVDAILCTPEPRPVGPWELDPPVVGQEYARTWEVEHAAPNLTIRDVPPDLLPGDEPYSATVTLGPDLTFTLPPRVLIEGEITTDNGNLAVIARERMDGAVSVAGAAPRITILHELTWEFREVGPGALVTTCVDSFSATAVRESL